MVLKESGKDHAANLRRQTEVLVRKSREFSASKSNKDAGRVVHELEAHQVELEIQNKKLSHSLIELEKAYDELYNFAPVGYFVLTPRGIIERANLTGAKMLGQVVTRLRGQRFPSFVSPESIPDFTMFLRRVVGGNEKESCIVVLMKGTNTPVTAFIEATGMGPKSSFRAVVVDITSTEQANLALRESEDHLQMVLAASKMGLWQWECDSQDIYCSDECYEISGISSLCPKLDVLAKLVHPDDLQLLKSAITEILAYGKEQSVEFRIIRPDGEVAWIASNGHVHHDNFGKPLHLVGLVQDISERKRQQQAASSQRLENPP